MSVEGTNSNQEDVTAMVSEHPFLSRDAYTKRVLETGVADNGKRVDIKDFLAARGAILEMNAAEARANEIRNKNFDAYDAAVVHSVRPDQEKAWVN